MLSWIGTLRECNSRFNLTTKRIRRRVTALITMNARRNTWLRRWEGFRWMRDLCTRGARSEVGFASGRRCAGRECLVMSLIEMIDVKIYCFVLSYLLRLRLRSFRCRHRRRFHYCIYYPCNPTGGNCHHLRSFGWSYSFHLSCCCFGCIGSECLADSRIGWRRSLNYSNLLALNFALCFLNGSKCCVLGWRQKRVLRSTIWIFVVGIGVIIVIIVGVKAVEWC